MCIRDRRGRIQVEEGIMTEEVGDAEQTRIDDRLVTETMSKYIYLISIHFLVWQFSFSFKYY